MPLENANIVLTERKGKHRQTNVFSTKTQHKTEIRKYNEQQTTNTYFICNKIQEEQTNTRRNNQTIQNYEEVTVQIEHSNNNTERRRIRTTWSLFAEVIVCKKKMQASDQQKVNTTINLFFNRNTIHDRLTAKEQTTNNYQILYM